MPIKIQELLVRMNITNEKEIKPISNIMHPFHIVSQDLNTLNSERKISKILNLQLNDKFER